VSVGSGQDDGERQALSVDHDVPLGARLTAVGRVRAANGFVRCSRPLPRRPSGITAKMARVVHAVIKSGDDYRPFVEGPVPGGRTPLSSAVRAQPATL
jgi:hypothetical protein